MQHREPNVTLCVKSVTFTPVLYKNFTHPHGIFLLTENCLACYNRLIKLTLTITARDFSALTKENYNEHSES